ncbi:movement protein 2 [Gompholobium virus A]|uniref:Movement protein 2 n=1 Tax=Gompholobium virus A TaxID=1884832 RepID=A0A1B2ARZ4_9TOMB|nr:movement protein 2 [Gompholobium virus A]ANY30824.1 movement protein 2 [Gompholobium virus A]
MERPNLHVTLVAAIVISLLLLNQYPLQILSIFRGNWSHEILEGIIVLACSFLLATACSTHTPSYSYSNYCDNSKTQHIAISTGG